MENKAIWKNKKAIAFNLEEAKKIENRGTEFIKFCKQVFGIDLTISDLEVQFEDSTKIRELAEPKLNNVIKGLTSFESDRAETMRLSFNKKIEEVNEMGRELRYAINGAQILPIQEKKLNLSDFEVVGAKLVLSEVGKIEIEKRFTISVDTPEKQELAEALGNWHTAFRKLQTVAVKHGLKILQDIEPNKNMLLFDEEVGSQPNWTLLECL